MTTMETKPRRTYNSAKRERFEPSAGIPATNVQDAIASVYNSATASPPVLAQTSVTFGQSPYIVLSTDYVLAVDTTGGAVAITMMPAAARGGKSIEIKDVAGNAGVNAITVNLNGAETVDGLAPYLIDMAYGSARFTPKAAGGYFVNA